MSALELAAQLSAFLTTLKFRDLFTEQHLWILQELAPDPLERSQD